MSNKSSTISKKTMKGGASSHLRRRRRRRRRRQDPQQSMLPSFAMGFVAFVVYLYLHSERVDPRTSFLSWFQDQGGWISPAVTLFAETKYGNGLLVQQGSNESTTTTTVVQKSEKILEIPVDLLMTQASASTKLGSGGAITQDALTRTIDTIHKELPYPLDQQDAWIALELMLECSKDSESRYAPYLKILPSKVPRLASFSVQEFELLQDEDMTQYGKSQHQALQRVWEGAAKELLILLQGTTDSVCITASSFHHYVGLSASRAMILNDTKYLTPMAEMINHADNPGTDEADFQGHHKLQGDKLLVYADRSFHPGQELVEEYGKLDNSLYISSFGFVPLDNPHHCVFVDSICVKRNGQPANESQRNELRKLAMPNCSNDEDDCWKQQDEQVRGYLQRVATQKLSSYPTTLQKDLELLTQFESSGDWEGMDPDKVRLAMQFRIEEKKVLTSLAMDF